MDNKWSIYSCNSFKNVLSMFLGQTSGELSNNKYLAKYIVIVVI